MTCAKATGQLEALEQIDRADTLNGLTVGLQKLLQNYDQRLVLVLNGIDRQRGASLTLLPALARLGDTVGDPCVRIKLQRNALTTTLDTEPQLDLHIDIATALVPSESRRTARSFPSLYAQRAARPRHYSASFTPNPTIRAIPKLHRLTYPSEIIPPICSNCLRLLDRAYSFCFTPRLQINMFKIMASLHLALHIGRTASGES